MALAATNTVTGLGIGRVFSAIVAGIGNWLVVAAESNGRVKMVQYLQSLSDAELAKRGLAREDIVRHVFADCTGI